MSHKVYTSKQKKGKLSMPGIEGRSSGIATVSRSAGISRGGGSVGLATRSIATGRSIGAESGFSSRGLAGFKSERPVMSSMPNGFEAKKSAIGSYGSHFSQEFQSSKPSPRTERITALPSRNRLSAPENKPTVTVPRIPFERPSSENISTKDIAKKTVIPDLIGDPGRELDSRLRGNDKRVDYINKIQPRLDSSKLSIDPLSEIQNKVAVNQMPFKELMTKSVIVVEQSMKPVVGTAFETLASLPDTSDLGEEQEKRSQAFRTEEIQRVGQAYVNTGLAHDVSTGVKMTERFLKVQPTVVARNPVLEVATLPQAQTTQSVRTESSPMILIKTESVTASNAKVENNERTITQTKREERNQTLKKKAPIIVFDRPNRVALSHKLDVEAQKNRIQQLKTAVQKIFPVFNYSYRASLNEVAAVLEKPTTQTTSQLIIELGKNVDGSEIWRDALNSDAEVTAAEAIQTGLRAIAANKPVMFSEEGPAVKDEDVKLVLKDEKEEEYALAA